MLFAAWGIGGIIAAALTPRLLRKRSTAWVTLAFIPASAAAGVAVALSRHWMLATSLMIAWGVAYQVVIINALTYRQQVTPEHLLGRVNTAGRMLSHGVGWTGGALAAGALVGWLGLASTLVLMVAIGALAAAYGWGRRCAAWPPSASVGQPKGMLPAGGARSGRRADEHDRMDADRPAS